MNARNIRRIAVSVIWVIAFVVWVLWDRGSSHPHRGQQAAQMSQQTQRANDQARQANASQPAATNNGPRRLDFQSVRDFTLALTWEPGFCRDHAQRAECRGADQMPLALHGFWPGEPNSLSQQGINRGEWFHDGCLALDHQHAGSFCSFPKPPLSSQVQQALNSAMPGVQSCLDRHEYAKHGACFNISADQYFGHATRLYQAVSHSSFAHWLQAHRGQRVARQDIISTFGSSFETSGRALMLMCDRDDNLNELRIGIKGQTLNDFPAANSFTRLGNGRCGSQVQIP